MICCRPTLKQYWLCWPQLHRQQGVLYHKWEGVNGRSSLKLIVPRLLQEQIIHDNHDIFTGKHPGPEQTLFRIRQKHYWYRMWRDAEVFVKRCTKCATTKHCNRGIKALLQQFHEGCRLERVYILSQFLESSQENKYILVVIDQFTEWLEAYPVPN